jgi:taurine dioxygenase
VAGAFEIIPICPTIGAEIRGLELARPLDPATFESLYAALVEHKVIYFRDQDMTPEEQIAFGRQFGELETHPFRPDRPGMPEFVVLDNHEHNPVLSTDIWHADTTFREGPTKFSILRCLQIPERGGDTLWADMVAAYEGLSEPLKELIAGLEAIHDFKNFALLYSGDDGNQDKLQEMKRKFPNPAHPVVRTHPDTNERVLYVNPQFTVRITGMSVRESDGILGILYEQAKTPEYQFRLQWEPGTVAMWDNRSTQHYASNDYWPARRHMERVAIVGEKPYFDPDAQPERKGVQIKRVHAYEGLH